MLECIKRQKIVTRQTGDVKHKCIHSKSDDYLNIVTEDICAQCPVRAYRQPPPDCKNKPRVFTPDCGSCNEVDDPVTATIQNKLPNLPSTAALAARWAKEVKNWVKAGRPKRSDEQVEDILSVCDECSWYMKDARRCRGCGCNVNDGAFAVLNKARMATAHCPQGKW
jgi:hypothetical protein